MPSNYSIHLEDSGQCDYCDDSTPYLFHSDRLVDGGLDQPVSVAVWACPDCLDAFDDEVESFLEDWFVRYMEPRRDAPFNEWRPEPE